MFACGLKNIMYLLILAHHLYGEPFSLNHVAEQPLSQFLLFIQILSL